MKDTKKFTKPAKNAGGGVLNNPQKVRKAFSLVELVIAILIIAVLVAAVFTGGSIIIKNAQISRTTSDLHNFSIAVESWMNQNPTIANVRNNESYKKDTALYNSFNALLAEDYKLEDVANTSNITAVQAADGGDYYIYRSKKTDAWGNAYYVVFTDQERSDLEGNKHSEFFVEVISAGPNAKAKIGGAEDKIDGDDIFLVGQYTDGNVVSKIYNYDDDKPVNDSGVAATSYTADAKAPIATKATTMVSAPSTPSTPSIPAGSEPTLIQFSIQAQGTPKPNRYQAEEGMTWLEWCNSDYNTGGLECNSNSEKVSAGHNLIIKDSLPYIIGSDIISANTVYTTAGSGGN